MMQYSIQNLKFLYKKNNHFDLHKIYDHSFFCLLFALPLFPFFSNIITVILILLFFFIKNDSNFYTKFKKPIFILWGLLLYILCKAIITGHFLEEFNYYQKLYTLFLIPILYIKVSNTNLQRKAILFSGFFAMILSIINLFRYYAVYKYFPLSEGIEVNQILKIERPYFGFLLIICILFCLELYKTTIRKYKVFYAFLAVMFTCFIVFIAARNAIISLIILTIIYFVIYSKQSHYSKLIFCSLFFISLFILVVNNENLKQRVFYSDNLSIMINKNLQNEPRTVIWPCVFEITTNAQFNKLFGFSSEKEARLELNNCYSNNIMDNDGRRDWFVSINYNSHNQFLGVYLIGGFIALCLLLVFFAFLLWNNKGDFFLFSISCSIFCFFTFENVLERQFGTNFIAFLISIMLVNKNEKN